MKTAIALGTFDGLHKGHLAVIKPTLEYSSRVVTFEFPPKFADGRDNLLMTPNDKISALEKIGVKDIETLKFHEIKDIEAEDFLTLLNQKYSPALISCGENYRFGKGAKGNKNILKEFCEKHSIIFNCATLQTDGGEVICSTAIRKLIENGEIHKANKLLFSPFSFKTAVNHGDGRGHTLGFPTANQDYPDCLIRPLFGVYETRATVDGREYKAITNIGIRPTFKTDSITCETYLLGFKDNVYNKEMKLEFLRFLRKEKKFENTNALKLQIEKDIREVLL